MAALFSRGFKVEKVKPYLKMSIERIHFVKAKKSAAIKKTKKEVVDFLREGKEEKARIRTEHIVRQDFFIEALDILELMCEVVIERIRLIEVEKECPFDMREPICTIVYAADRTEVKELKNVKEQFQKKYGKDFIERASQNVGGVVNDRVVAKLSGSPPNAFLVLNYMKEIAKSANLDWEPDEATEQIGQRFDMPMAAPTGASIAPGAGSGLGATGYKVTDGILKPPVAPAAPGTSNHDNDAFDFNINYDEDVKGDNGKNGIDIGQIPFAPPNVDNVKLPPQAPSPDDSSSSASLSTTNANHDHDSANHSIHQQPGSHFGGKGPNDDSVPDYDELTRRFAQLKNQQK